MKYLLVSLAIFLLTLALQLTVHRARGRKGAGGLKTLLIYPGGLVMVAGVEYWLARGSPPIVDDSTPWWSIPLPATAIFLFALLAILTATFLITPLLGQPGPTSKIMASFRRHPAQTLTEIEALFTPEEFLDRRLGDLTSCGILRKTGRGFSLSGIGKILAGAVAWYGRLLGLGAK